MTSRQRIIVTGASGFIGHALLDRLSRDPRFDVLAIVSPRDSIKSETLLPVDLLDLESIRRAFEEFRPEVVINCAGRAHVKDAHATVADFAVNAEGALNVALASVSAGATRLIHLSSVLVYGRKESRTVTEEMEARPEGPYAESKLLGESLVCKVAGETGLSVGILRLAMVPGTSNHSNLSDLAEAILRGRFLWVGEGSNLKSLVSLGDVIRAIEAEILTARVGGVEVFNLAGEVLPMRVIVQSLASGLGVTVPKFSVPVVIAKAGSVLFGGHLGIPKLERLTKFIGEDRISSEKFEDKHAFKFSDGMKELLVEFGAEIRAKRGEAA